MKKFSLVLAFMSGLIIMGIIGWKSNDHEQHKPDQNIQDKFKNADNQAILAVRKVKLKAGVSAEAFEKFAVDAANGEYGSLPGAKVYYGKGERGDEVGSYLSFIEFDSKRTRDFYAPVADDNSKTAPEVKKMIDTFFSKFSPEADKYVEVVATGKNGYTDYIILK